MAEYIEKSAAVVIADYAADEHPYSKDPEHPETYSDYNQGWNDACDYIRGKLEDMPDADVTPVLHSFWLTVGYLVYCHRCSGMTLNTSRFCPFCGAKMDGGTNA